MVKRQKEKQYQSGREHHQNAQLRSGSGMTGGVVQRILPFHCCALTLTPFAQPVCNAQGILFDSVALMEFVMKHKKDPVTGKPLTTRDIITLHMDQDDENRWQCPVLTKPFADHTKIVAIVDRTSKHSNVQAYVYSFEAYKELNVKSKNWVDLTTGKKFSPKKDVLILNDPQNEDFQKQRDIQGFWHIENSRSLDQKKKQTNVKHSITATRIMEKLQQDKKKRLDHPRTMTNYAENNTGIEPKWKKLKILSDDVTNVQYTSGKASGSFTSTQMEVKNENTTREATQEEVLRAQFQVMRAQKEKGYVRMITSMGDLLLELHCDIAPRSVNPVLCLCVSYRLFHTEALLHVSLLTLLLGASLWCQHRTCTNFLGLCQAKMYDGSSFYRSIPSFMIQGGQSVSGDGKDDVSVWGGAFADEFDDRLKHDQRGVLSSANAGPNTNKRQFFVSAIVDPLTILNTCDSFKICFQFPKDYFQTNARFGPKAFCVWPSCGQRESFEGNGECCNGQERQASSTNQDSGNRGSGRSCQGGGRQGV